MFLRVGEFHTPSLSPRCGNGNGEDPTVLPRALHAWTSHTFCPEEMFYIGASWSHRWLLSS